MQPYVPVHRRNVTEERKESPVIRSNVTDTTEIKKRGRGQFKAPMNNDSQDGLTTQRIYSLPSTNTLTKEETNAPHSTASGRSFSLDSPKSTIEYSEYNNRNETTKSLNFNRADRANLKRNDSRGFTNTTSKGDDFELFTDRFKGLGLSEIDRRMGSVPDNINDIDDWEQETLIPNVSHSGNSSKTRKSKKSEYSLLSKAEDMMDTTALDCYDFPNTFKTVHLKEMFREYESMRGGYSIKWMDDTRALIIFEHPETANKAYSDNMNNGLVKIRPYRGHIEMKPAGPVPRRPMTTDMVAKRLVHGALGVKTPLKSAEQRKAEQEMLSRAREEKLNERLARSRRQKEIANAFEE
ncbi:hypothetical protein BDB01DRAFT_850196 [Pilobolus umbonatus]|nr:hypothetical protein BDB01DRAFT_850196 [Pilobolus umbonatus]